MSDLDRTFQINLTRFNQLVCLSSKYVKKGFFRDLERVGYWPSWSRSLRILAQFYMEVIVCRFLTLTYQWTSHDRAFYRWCKRKFSTVRWQCCSLKSWKGWWLSMRWYFWAILRGLLSYSTCWVWFASSWTWSLRILHEGLCSEYCLSSSSQGL